MFQRCRLREPRGGQTARRAQLDRPRKRLDCELDGDGESYVGPTPNPLARGVDVVTRNAAVLLAPLLAKSRNPRLIEEQFLQVKIEKRERRE